MLSATRPLSRHVTHIVVDESCTTKMDIMEILNNSVQWLLKSKMVSSSLGVQSPHGSTLQHGRIKPSPFLVEINMASGDKRQCLEKRVLPLETRG